MSGINRMEYYGSGYTAMTVPQWQAFTSKEELAQCQRAEQMIYEWLCETPERLSTVFSFVEYSSGIEVMAVRLKSFVNMLMPHDVSAAVVIQHASDGTDDLDWIQLSRVFWR